MLEFREKYGRDPDSANLEADLAELAKLRTSVATRLGLPNPDIVPEDFVR